LAQVETEMSLAPNVKLIDAKKTKDERIDKVANRKVPMHFFMKHEQTLIG